VPPVQERLGVDGERRERREAAQHTGAEERADERVGRADLGDHDDEHAHEQAAEHVDAERAPRESARRDGEQQAHRPAGERAEDTADGHHGDRRALSPQHRRLGCDHRREPSPVARSCVCQPT